MGRRVWNVSRLVRIVRRKMSKSNGGYTVFIVQFRTNRVEPWSDRWPDDPDFSLKQAFESVSHLPNWLLNDREWSFNGGDNR